MSAEAMDPFRNPPADTLAAARLHVQALTECGLPREALLRALLENYNDADAAARIDTGFSQQGQQPAQSKMGQGSFNTHLSVSTTSSKSSGRASVMSTATSTSSVSSPGGAAHEIAPPAPPAKSSNRWTSKAPGAYWCTFCDVAFQRKFDWKRHEDEFHERYKRYPCPNCNSVFWGANTFNQHHKNAHGCTTCPHADRVVRFTHRKQAWACGFCGGFLPSRDRYFDHVARHYEDGCNKSHWNHSLVIYGLLHHPFIITAWRKLDATLYGHLSRNDQPILEWDHNTTGHAQGFLEGDSPGNLQDLLEFLVEDRDDPKLLARLAHESATIRFRHEIQQQQPNARPVSEPPPKRKPTVKATPAAAAKKHMSSPHPAPAPAATLPPPPFEDRHHQHKLLLPKKQRSVAPLFSSTFLQQQQRLFEQHQLLQQLPSQPPSSHDPIPPPFTQTTTTTPPTMVVSPAAAADSGFYDLALTQVHPHVQQQQLLMVPMNVYDDWSSMAGTVVDESVFASAMALGWQQAEMGQGGTGGRGYAGAGG